MRIVGIVFHAVFEDRLGCIDFAQIQQRDTLIQARHLQIEIERLGLLKFPQRFFEQLLVHVSEAEIVQAGGFGRIGLFWSYAQQNQSARQRHQGNEFGLAHAKKS